MRDMGRGRMGMRGRWRAAGGGGPYGFPRSRQRSVRRDEHRSSAGMRGSVRTEAGGGTMGRYLTGRHLIRLPLRGSHLLPTVVPTASCSRRSRQAGHFLEISSLFPPQAALR